MVWESKQNFRYVPGWYIQNWGPAKTLWQLVMKDILKGPVPKIAMIIYPMFEDFGNETKW